MGDMTLRVATLSQALLLASRGGDVILDDVHKPGYGAHARRIAAASALWWLDMRRVTEDELGRYSMLVHRI
jgi:glycine/D-amino acid oxidase-like deaminating enzyme